MNNKYKILFVEDEKNILDFVSALLEANEYQVITAKSCFEAITLYSSYIPDLVILDLGLPDKDGSTVLEEIRKKASTPVIVLSARSEEGEKVKMLDMGANDYVTKPFGSAELLARIRSCLRLYSRGEKGQAPRQKFTLRDLCIDYDSRRVWIENREIKFTQTEYNILALLSAQSEKIMTYSSIIRSIWGEYPDENSIKKLQVNMANIRKKLGTKTGELGYIINELGVGYRMND